MTDPDDNDPDVVCQIGLVHGLEKRADLNGHMVTPLSRKCTHMVPGAGAVLRVGFRIDSPLILSLIHI